MNKLVFSSVDTQRIWERVLAYVKPRLGREVIETWFEPVSLEGIDGIQGPNDGPRFYHYWWYRLC